ncbi:hypothetical protein WA026_000182 [Henosepilachna vigintioctopunctata]|uniref:Uncharacterized protein n=1 Tax=Henosepilachna vigintioctopunctata TaxID=420089 RepID=A0AAW1UWS1_9CUCU
MGANWSAPIRNLFSKGKAKEDIQHGVEEAVNAAEKGVEKIEELLDKAVNELSAIEENAQLLKKTTNEEFEKKKEMVEGEVKTVVHNIDEKVSQVQEKTGETLQNIGQSLKAEKEQLRNEFYNVGDNAKKNVEHAEDAMKTAFKSTEDKAASVLKKLDDEKNEIQNAEESEGDFKDLEEKVIQAQKAFESSPLLNNSAKVERTEGVKVEEETKVDHLTDTMSSAIKDNTKTVSDFLNKEITDASQQLTTKKDQLTDGLSNAASALSSKAKEDVQFVKSTLSDTLTDVGASITNTLHNIESGIVGGLESKAHDAADFLAGTEEVDDKLEDKELKNEAVSTLLEKSLLK